MIITRQQRRVTERAHLKIVRKEEKARERDLKSGDFDTVINRAIADAPEMPGIETVAKTTEALTSGPALQMLKMGVSVALTTLGDETEPDKVFMIAQGAKYGVVQITNHAMQAIGLERMPIECSKGCDACCYLPVAASPVECLLLARRLKEKLPNDQYLATVEQVRLVATRIQGMSHHDREGARIPCGLLSDHKCLAYQERPLSCLGWTSTSRKDCEDAYSGKTHGAEVKMFGPLFMAATEIGAGVLMGLGSRNLDNTGVELNAGLLIALETPDAEARWLAGEKLFESAAMRMDEVK